MWGGSKIQLKGYIFIGVLNFKHPLDDQIITFLMGPLHLTQVLFTEDQRKCLYFVNTTVATFLMSIKDFFPGNSCDLFSLCVHSLTLEAMNSETGLRSFDLRKYLDVSVDGSSMF